jgi:beta-lactamase regulating signal transducer with metallopeptidase domain
MKTMAQAFSHLGAGFPNFAWSMFWQSSLLIGSVFVIDFLLSRKLRPTLRYAFWLLVLVKLTLPPSLAFPTGIAWWVRPAELRPPVARTTTVLVRYGESQQSSGLTEPSSSTAHQQGSVLTIQDFLVLSFLAGAFVLFTVMLLRWRYVAVATGCATRAPDELQRLLRGSCDLLGLRSSVRLRVTDWTSTPVVFGFLRPVILLPACLLSRLSGSQMRAVLLHELIHLRRGDVWVNCFQTLLQLAYWWHPLVWLSNARIRRIREEAVDDAVMLALNDEDETYPQALLEVAKLALSRPLSSLALVGILETRHALRRRIERLVNLTGRPKRGLTLASMAGLVAFGALALPMGQAPSKMAPVSETRTSASDEWPDPRFTGYAEVSLNARFLIVDPTSLELFLASLAGAQGPLILGSNEVSEVERKLTQADAQSFPRSQSLSFGQFSGGRFHYRAGGVSGNAVDYQTQTRSNGSTFVLGAECSTYVGGRPDWVPLDFTVVPWVYTDSTLCQLRLGTAEAPESAQQAEVTIPSGGAMLWRVPQEMLMGKSEFVLLKEGKVSEDDRATSRAPEQKPGGENGNVGELVQEARSFYEAGKLDDAEASLRKALAIDRDSPAAHYYLGLIERSRASQRPPVGPLNIETNRVHSPTAPEGILATLTRIRLNHISFDHQPLAEVLNTLNNEVSPVVTFRMDAPVAADAQQDLAKVPITVLPALTDIRLIDVLDVIVKVSPQRIRYSIETNGVVFAASRSKPLYNRVIKVDPKAFFEGLEQASGETNVASAFQSVLRARGLELQAPETFFFSDGSGYLMVRTTLEKMDRIEKTISELIAPLAQLNIKTRFLRLPDAMLNDLQASRGIVQTVGSNSSKILTPAQTSVLLRAINTAKYHSNLLSEASVTTLSGRQAEVECVELHSIVSNNVPVQVPIGPAIDLTPRLGPEGWKISLRVLATVRELLGYDDPSKIAPEDPSSTPKPSGSVTHIRITDATVPDGYTLVVVKPVGQKSELAKRSAASESHYAVLITPTVIDRAGNRLHTDAEIEALCR